MNTETFVKLPSPIEINGRKEPLDKLRVNIDYQKGGWNCFTGEYCENGIFAYITPCTHENGVTGTIIDGILHHMGFKVLIKEMGRKSQKQIEKIAAAVLPNAQEIANLYGKEDYNEVVKLIKSSII